MAKVNLDKLNLKELHEIRAKAAKQIESRRKSEIKKIRKEINSMIKENGFTLSDIFPSMKPATKNKTAAQPKYRNPDNTEETWAGRGRKPKWLEAKIASGSKEDEFLIH